MSVVTDVRESDVEDVSIPSRPIPQAAWTTIFVLMLMMTTVAVATWEFQMRRLGLIPDVGDDPPRWAAQRHKVDSGPRDSLIVLGDSRLLFDTNFQVWRELTGLTPIQLAIAGGSGRPVLTDLAKDEHFAGLAVLGIGTSYFATVDGGANTRSRTNYWKNETPAQRLSESLYVPLANTFAFLDQGYTLPFMIESAQIHDRPGIRGPATQPWKLGITLENRQTYMWDRMLTDKYLYTHQRLAWDPYNPKTYSDAKIEGAIEETRRDVEAIRKRGGEVVLIQAPVAGDLHTRIWTDLPRQRGWDPLIAKAGVFGIHFEDYPEMQNLNLPEWSHLSRDSATQFTRAYVTVLKEKVPWLQAHPRVH